MNIPVLRGIEQSVRKLKRRLFRNDIRRGVEDVFNALEEQGLIVIHPCGDHRVALALSDKVIGSHVLRNGDWFRAETTWAIEFLARRNLLPPNPVFVDVGANIGTQSLYALLSGRFDRVLALEPSPAQFDLLRLNAYLGDFQERIACRRIAAGARTQTLTLLLNSTNQGDNRLTRDAALEGPRVSVEPLDAILETEDIVPTEIGLVWMDVQGHEFEVILGMSGVLTESVPLVIEFNSDQYGVGGVVNFIALLEPHYDSCIDLTSDDRSAHSLYYLKEVTSGRDILIYRDAPSSAS